MQTHKLAAIHLKEAFPKLLSHDVFEVEREIAKRPIKLQPAGSISKFPILIGNEELRIPNRIYSEELSDAQTSSWSDERRRIFWCIYSRHHNGYIREKYLLKLLESPCAYSVPFILQLLGEYIEELGILIRQSLRPKEKKVYCDFLKSNPRFLDLLHSRIASYWNAYYRNKYPDIKNYPPYQVLTELR